MHMWNTNSGWFQTFIYRNNQFENIKDKRVIEVLGNKDAEGANVGINAKKNQRYQKWNIVYLDTKGRDKIKGMNTNFGFFINRPFYIVSKMWMSRVVEIVGGRNLVIKSRVHGRNTQQWIFDQKSKTIKSVAYKGRSFDIQNSGTSSNMQAWTTNSRWF